MSNLGVKGHTIWNYIWAPKCGIRYSQGTVTFSMLFLLLFKTLYGMLDNIKGDFLVIYASL